MSDPQSRPLLKEKPTGKIPVARGPASRFIRPGCKYSPDPVQLPLSGLEDEAESEADDVVVPRAAGANGGPIELDNAKRQPIGDIQVQAAAHAQPEVRG